MIEDKGEVTVADRELSSHKQNTIYAKVGDRNITVTFEELGSWEMPLINDRTDMVIQQRYGNITYREGDIVKSGVAMTEYGFGKYGDKHVRISLVENEHRIRQAARSIKNNLKL